MRTDRAYVGECDGMDSYVSPVELEPNLHQLDQGSHTLEGCWQPRRGMVAANVDGKSAAPVGLIAFEADDGDYVAVLAEGANLHSEAAFDAGVTEDPEGLGEGGFGEGGFGE